MTSSLGSSVSRACFRVSKWIEPGIRLARNIQSSKQLTSLKSTPPSSSSFNSSRVIVIIDKINHPTCSASIAQQSASTEWRVLRCSLNFQQLNYLFVEDSFKNGTIRDGAFERWPIPRKTSRKG